MITIEKNDYVKPTKIRENVVQHILDAFLDDNNWSRCHLCSDPHGRGYRCRDSYVLKRKGEKAYGFNDEPFDSDVESVIYHECEMREAFRILIENGYHIFRKYDYGTWPAYVVRKCDFCNGGTEVRDFSERWDQTLDTY